MSSSAERRQLGSGAACTLVCAAFFSAATGPSAVANDYTWQVSASMTAESGDYGTDSDTDLFYLPVTLKRYLERGEVAITVPYLDLQSDGGQTVVDGAVVSGSGSGGSGLGDVVLKGTFNWIEQNEKLPFIDLVARLKLPTADEDKGLGTGEADIGFGVEAARRFDADKIWFADLTYTFIGEPPDADYDNRLALQLGIGRDFTPELMCSAFYDFRTAISDESDDAHSISGLADYKISAAVRVYGMIEIGLSDGAPDYGLTVGASYRFN